VKNNLDCDSDDASVHPDGVDVAGSGIDSNCDGIYLWYYDSDEDGFAGETIVSSENASPGVGEFSEATDCDDGDANVYPGAPALADGKDNDCDGTVDKEIQTITMEEIPDQLDDDNAGPIQINGETTSNLEISYDIEGPATLEGDLITLTGAGSVTVTATQPGNDGYSEAEPVIMTFCVNPNPLIVEDQENNFSSLLISNYLTGNQWFFEGEAIAEATAPTLFVDEGGIYKLKVSVGSCAGTSEEQEVVITGLEAVLNSSLEIYPVPTKDILTIQSNQIKPSQIRIIDSSGKQWYRKEIKSNLTEINVSHFQKGMYSIILDFEEGTVVRKMVKQ